MFKKRFFAYLIDILILSCIISFISMFFNSDNYINLNNELNQINNSFINGEIPFETYFNQFYTVNFSIQKELFFYNLFSVVISILYFVVYPIYNGGQSFGKKIMKIKIVSDSDRLFSNSLIFRYLFMDGIGVSILSLCLICFVNGFYFMIFNSILSFLQFLVVIISIFMVIYRDDEKSLPDLIAGTKVIEVE